MLSCSLPSPSRLGTSGASLVTGGPVQRLGPVEKIGQAVGILVQVAGGDVVVAGRGQEERRPEERRPLRRRRLVGVVDRPELLAILGDPAPVVDDVAGDHHEIGSGLVGLKGHGSLLGRVHAAVSEDHEPLRYVACLGGAAVGPEHDLTRFPQPIREASARLEAGELRPIKPVRRYTLHRDPAHRRGGCLAP